MRKKEFATFRFDPVLLEQFRKVAKARGHTMTWYLEGCMREVVGQKRRGVRAKQLALPAESKT